MVQPVMAIGRVVKLLVLLPALTTRCDESQATRNQLTVIMRRVDMHCYTSIPPITPYYRQTALCLLTPPRIVLRVEQADQT